MARTSNADLLARYRKQIEVCRKWRREEGYDDLWCRLSDLYRGKQYEYMSEEDRLLINVCFATVNVIAPSVAVNYPKIAVNAQHPDNAVNAIHTEVVVNYWWKRYKVRPQFRLAVKDYLVMGHGWMKQGYRYVEEQMVGTDSQPDDINEGESDGDGEGAGDHDGAGATTSTTIVVEDRPFSERVSPHDMFVDPDATCMDDARWIAQRVRRPLREVKADKRYGAIARSQAQACATGLDSSDPQKREMVDKDMGYVDIWEYYDIVRGTMAVFSQGGDAFLVKPFKMPYAFGHPYVMIRNYDVPDCFYPMGDLEAIEPLQRELNETRTQMMNHRKRYARKYLFKEDAFDSTGKAALNSDDDNVMVPVNSQEDLSKVVFPMPTTMTPPEFYQQSDLIQSDVSFVTAISEYQRGGLPEIRRTATEAAIVQDAANARAADKLAQIEQAIADVAYRLVKLAQQYMDSEQVARVVGRDGKAAWLTFDKEYIAGEFDFDVEAGSTAPNNESFRRQSAMQMMDAMAPLIQLGVVDARQLAAHVLQYGFGVKNPEQFLAQSPPPMPQEAGPEGAPTGAQPGDPGLPPGGMPQAVAPPPTSPDALSGIDPGVLAALSSKNGLSLPGMGVG